MLLFPSARQDHQDLRLLTPSGSSPCRRKLCGTKHSCTEASGVHLLLNKSLLSSVGFAQFLPMTDTWPRHKNAVDLRETVSEEKAGIQTMWGGHVAAREAHHSAWRPRMRQSQPGPRQGSAFGELHLCPSANSRGAFPFGRSGRPARGTKPSCPPFTAHAKWPAQPIPSLKSAGATTVHLHSRSSN